MPKQAAAAAAAAAAAWELGIDLKHVGHDHGPPNVGVMFPIPGGGGGGGQHVDVGVGQGKICP
jgi:hypothetical protein